MQSKKQKERMYSDPYFKNELTGILYDLKSGWIIDLREELMDEIKFMYKAIRENKVEDHIKDFESALNESVSVDGSSDRAKDEYKRLKRKYTIKKILDDGR